MMSGVTCQQFFALVRAPQQQGYTVGQGLPTVWPRAPRARDNVLKCPRELYVSTSGRGSSFSGNTMRFVMFGMALKYGKCLHNILTAP
jgi:hypothetical protein